MSEAAEIKPGSFEVTSYTLPGDKPGTVLIEDSCENAMDIWVRNDWLTHFACGPALVWTNMLAGSYDGEFYTRGSELIRAADIEMREEAVGFVEGAFANHLRATGKVQ